MENIAPPNKVQKTTLGQTLKELNAAPEENRSETEQESYAQKRAKFQQNMLKFKNLKPIDNLEEILITSDK